MSNAKPLTLVIGDKNLSSWSLRPWLLMRHFDVPFTEVRLKLDIPEFYQRIRDYSPSSRVPALHVGEQVIWDSLSICEFINECYLQGAALPKDPMQRATARSVIAEMHSGFGSLRQNMPMNLKRKAQPPAEVSAQTESDIQRVTSLWRELLAFSSGPFLFGEFGMADCFYAPVVTRFVSYGVHVGSDEQGYMDRVQALPAFKTWKADALAEAG